MSALVPRCPSELTPKDSFIQGEQKHGPSALAGWLCCTAGLWFEPNITSGELPTAERAEKQTEIYLKALLHSVCLAGLLPRFTIPIQHHLSQTKHQRVQDILP